MKKSLIFILLAIALIVAGWFVWSSPRQVSAPGDADISEVDSVDLGNLDTEFQSIDSDLNQL